MPQGKFITPNPPADFAKRQYQSESFQDEVGKRKLPSEDSDGNILIAAYQTKAPKPKVPSETSQVKDLRRKFPSERSQTKIIKPGFFGDNSK